MPHSEQVKRWAKKQRITGKTHESVAHAARSVKQKKERKTVFFHELRAVSDARQTIEQVRQPGQHVMKMANSRAWQQTPPLGHRAIFYSIPAACQAPIAADGKKTFNHRATRSGPPQREHGPTLPRCARPRLVQASIRVGSEAPRRIRPSGLDHLTRHLAACQAQTGGGRAETRLLPGQSAAA